MWIINIIYNLSCCAENFTIAILLWTIRGGINLSKAVYGNAFDLEVILKLPVKIWLRILHTSIKKFYPALICAWIITIFQFSPESSFWILFFVFYFFEPKDLSGKFLQDPDLTNSFRELEAKIKGQRRASEKVDQDIRE